MSRTLFAAMILVALTVSASATTPENFVAVLSGEEEVPARDTDARGTAKMQLVEDELGYRLTVANIENVVASHIHLGPDGENGPVVAFLYGNVPAGGGDVDGVLATGTITEEDLVGPLLGHDFSELVDAIRSGNAYVNVHTNDGVEPMNTGAGDFPGGEIRGQLE